MKRLLLILAAAFIAGPAPGDDPKKPPAAPDKPAPEKKMETITLGAGCFWCTEVILQRVKGVQTVVSGYSNGHVKNPTYDQVCSGRSGHAEVVQVTFDPAVLPLEKVLHVFFELHDPTTLNRQGNDVGTQYRSGIYYHTDSQKVVAEKVKAEADKGGKFKNPIVTEIVKVDNFSKAEGNHQNYFNENYTKGTGNWGYCNALIIPKLKKMGLLKPDEEKVAKRAAGED
jgi:peptide-methionine (S)-S-oxide reductase